MASPVKSASQCSHFLRARERFPRSQLGQHCSGRLTDVGAVFVSYSSHVGARDETIAIRCRLQKWRQTLTEHVDAGYRLWLTATTADHASPDLALCSQLTPPLSYRADWSIVWKVSASHRQRSHLAEVRRQCGVSCPLSVPCISGFFGLVIMRFVRRLVTRSVTKLIVFKSPSAASESWCQLRGIPAQAYHPRRQLPSSSVSPRAIPSAGGPSAAWYHPPKSR